MMLKGWLHKGSRVGNLELMSVQQLRVCRSVFISIKNAQLKAFSRDQWQCQILHAPEKNVKPSQNCLFNIMQAFRAANPKGSTCRRIQDLCVCSCISLSVQLSVLELAYSSIRSGHFDFISPQRRLSNPQLHISPQLPHISPPKACISSLNP